MYGFIIIALFYGAGVLLNKYAYIPLPGNLIGLLLLALALLMGWIPMDRVEKAGNFLLRHLLFFFIPIMLNVIPYLSMVTNQPWPTVVALLTGPLIVLYVSGKVVQYLHDRTQRQDRHQCEKGDLL